MKRYELSEKEIRLFRNYLESEEYAVGTTEKYLRDLKHFRVWLNGRTVTKQIVIQWKEHLLAKGLLPITVNSKLAALNCFFKMMNWTSCQVKALRIQRRIFRSTERELGKEEYMRLIDAAAQAGKERLALLMETICAKAARALRAGKKVGIVCTEESLEIYRQRLNADADDPAVAQTAQWLADALDLAVIGSRKDPSTIAHNLFDVLRSFDGQQVDRIYSESFEGGQLGDAIMNRLKKAAGYHILDV